MTSPATNAFAKTLRTIRKGRSMSQYALANASDLDRTYISLLERGYRSPTLDTMFSLARALDVSLCEMVAATEASMQMDK